MKFLRFDDEFIKAKEIVQISAWYRETQEKKFKPAAYIYMKDGKTLTLCVKHGGASKQEFDSAEQAISEAAYRLSSITKAP